MEGSEDSARKSIGPKLGRQWNTPGEGELKWISISNPSPTNDTKYLDTLEARKGLLKLEEDFTPAGLGVLKSRDVERRQAKSRRFRHNNSVKSKKDKNIKQPWIVNVQEKQYKRNAFFDKEYTGDLFGTRGNYTNSFLYRSRHANGSRYILDNDDDYNIYTDGNRRDKNNESRDSRSSVNSNTKKELTKSLIDSIKALHTISKNSNLHKEIIDEKGYDSIIDIMYTIPPHEHKLFLLCGEFFCNLSDNISVNHRILPMRVVESMIYCANHLEFNQVFLCRVSRSLVNLSASKSSTESLVWQKGIATLNDWSKYDDIIIESMHKCLFNVVTSSTYKILPWFRECASLAVKVFKKQNKLKVGVQIILLSTLSHLASFPSLANAMIGLLIIGKLRERVEEIIKNEKYYHLLGERVQLLEWIVKIFYNMSRAVDACSKMSDEKIHLILDEILNFLSIGHYSEECTNLILGALGNIGRSPHARHRLIPKGTVLILKKACLTCVKQMKKVRQGVNKEKNPNNLYNDEDIKETRGNYITTYHSKINVYKDRLRICVEGLLHFTSDKEFMLQTCQQGSLRVLLTVCDMTDNNGLLYTAFTTACNILSSKILSDICELVPKDVEDFIQILFKQIDNKSLRIDDEKDPLGYIATSLRNITLMPRLVQYIADSNQPLAEMAIELAYRSFHDESILVLCAAILYNSTKNSITITALYSHENVAKIIGIMKKAKTPRVDELCLATLQNITHAFDSAGKVYEEGGAIEELVELAMSPDDNTRGLAVSVLCTLTYDDSNAETLVKENTLETLVEVAKTSTINASRVASAFNNFACIFNGKYIDKLIEIGAIKVLIDMLSSGKQKVRNEAAQALCHISCFSHYNQLALPLVPNIICRSENTSTYWRAVVAAAGVEQLVLTGLLRNSAENRIVQEFCCVGFYTLVTKAGVHHPLNKSIAWGAGKMYQLSDHCKDMANRILINLSEQKDGRLIINDTECLTEAAHTLLNMSVIDESVEENQVNDTTELQMNIMINICDIFYNVMTAKIARIHGNSTMLEALLLFGKNYGKAIDFDTRRRLIDLYCILGSTESTVALFATSRGFLVLETLFALDKKVRRSRKMDVEESKEVMKRAVIAAYSASTNPKLRVLAGMDGALERLLEYDPQLFDITTKKLVGVGIYNFSLVNDNELRHTMAKRGGLKICRELLEVKGIDKMVFMNRQRIFSRMAYLLSQTYEGLRLTMIEKGIMRVLLPCSLTKDPNIANEVATSLCNFSQIETGLVHLVQGKGLQATKNIIQNGARNYFNPKSTDSYEKCAIALSNMACHKNSQRKLVREGIVSMFQRLSGGKSLPAINACAKGIAFIGMNEAACTTILSTRGVIDNLTDWYQSARNQNGPQWRETESCIAFTIHQASLAKGTVEKKLVKEEDYAIKVIGRLEPEVLEHLRVKMTKEPGALKKLLDPPVEDIGEREMHEVFTKHNRLPTIHVIYDKQSTIKWKEHEYESSLIVSETMFLQEEPDFQISWADRKAMRLAQLNEKSGGLKRSLPNVVEIKNSLYQETSTLKEIPQFTYTDDTSFYEEMAARLKFIEDTNRKIEMQKQLVSCIKSLAIVSFDNNVKQALHLERERVFKIEEAARLKRLAEEMASEARKPLVSPTHRPKVVSFTKLPELLQSSVPLEATKNNIIGVKEIVRTIQTFDLNFRERKERNMDQNDVITKYLREVNATPGTSKHLKDVFGVTTPLEEKKSVNAIVDDNYDDNDLDINVEDVEQAVIETEISQPLTPLLMKTRNKQQHDVISEYLRQTNATPNTTQTLKNTFGVTTPSSMGESRMSSAINNQYDSVKTALLSAGNASTNKVTNTPNQSYSRNTQRKNIVNDYVATEKLTPSTKTRVEEYFGIDANLKKMYGENESIDPRIENFEEYTFGNYKRKYYK